jgi:hypothetical protein
MQAQAFLGLYPDYFGFKLALKFNVRRSAEEIADFADQAIHNALKATIDKKGHRLACNAPLICIGPDNDYCHRILFLVN